MIPKYLAHIADGRHNTFNQSHVMDTEDDIRVVGQGIFDALMIRAMKTNKKLDLQTLL